MKHFLSGVRISFRAGNLPLWFLSHTSLVLALYLFSFFLIPLSSYGYFQRWGSSARGRGVSEAISALPGEADVFSYNPSTLARMRGGQFTSQYTKVAGGFTDGTEVLEGGLQAAGRWGSWGWGGAWQTRGLTGQFREEVYALGVGTDAGAGWLQAIGVSVKFLRLDHAQNTYVPLNAALTNLSPTAWSFDVGWGWQLTDDIRAALAVTDLLEPAMSLVGESTPLSRGWRTGVVWQERNSPWWMAWDQAWRAGTYETGLGGEVDLSGAAIRAGLSGFGSQGFSSVRLSSWSLGMGYAWSVGWGTAALDYGAKFSLEGMPGDNVSHRISLGVRWIPPAIPEGEAGAPSLPPLAKVDLLPIPWWLSSMDHSGAEELDELLSVIQADRTNTPLVHRAALLMALERSAKEGETLYQHLLTLDPHYEFLGLQAIQRLRYQPKPAEILLDVYRQAAQEPEAPAEVLLGQMYLSARAGHFPEAVEVYKRWKRSASRPPLGALLTAALAMVETHNAAGALSVMAEVLSEGKDHAAVHEVWGRVLLEAGRPLEALEAFQAADRLTSDHVRSKFHMAVAQYQARLLPAALAMIGEVAGLIPQDHPVQERLAGFRLAIVDAYVALGDAAFLKNQLTEALGNFRQALEVDPGHLKAKEREGDTVRRINEEIQIHRDMALKAVSVGDLDQAVYQWQQVLGVDPANEEAQTGFAKTCEHLMRLAREKEQSGELPLMHGYVKALERVKPDDPEVKNLRAAFRKSYQAKSYQLEAEGRFPEAIAKWDEFLTLLPQDAEATQARERLVASTNVRLQDVLKDAKRYKDASRWAEAREKVREALSIQAGYQPAVVLSGEVAKSIQEVISANMVKAKASLSGGQIAEAKRLLSAVLKLEPDHREAKQEYQRLEKSESSREAELWREAQKLEAERKADAALKVLADLLAFRPAHEEGKKLAEVVRVRLAKAKEHTEKIKMLVLKGDLAYGDGNLRSALEAYEQASDLDYYNTDIRRKIDDVKKELK